MAGKSGLREETIILTYAIVDMKVIDKQLLFISSDERDSGSISDFTLGMPSHLLTCRSDQKMRMAGFFGSERDRLFGTAQAYDMQVPWR